jgi:deazaflavin-dependent oxidoreductase (nitroreductase family)
MRRLFLIVGSLGALAAAGVTAWRRNPRIGTRVVNTRVNPFLVRRGISGAARSEFGTMEHVGRRSGTRRLTPIHPVSSADGFRIMVPLGAKSEWARNVVAAGHCRIQFHDVVFDLDEPRLVDAHRAPGVSAPTRWLSARLGFQYLYLRRFAERPGTLESVGSEPSEAASAEGAQASVHDESTAVSVA